MGKPKTQVPISKTFSKNIDYLLKELRVEENFDVIHRKLEYENRKFALFFIDGFINAEAMEHIMIKLENISNDQLRKNTIDNLVKTFIPYVEVETTDDLEEVIGQVLAGQAALIVEQCSEAILIDTRQYPGRSPEEPDIERVVRGPRDGFVETMVFNTALIRRRLRDRSLVMEYMQIGIRSKADIILCYLDSVANPDLVQELKKEFKTST